MCKCTYINTCVRNGRLVVKANIGTKVNMHKVSVHSSPLADHTVLISCTVP